MAVKETRKLAKEEPSDIASEVLDDGYIDVMDDKTVALFPLGDMIIPTGIDYKPGDPEEDALAVTDALPEIEDLCFLEVPKFFSLKGSVVTPAMMLEPVSYTHLQEFCKSHNETVNVYSDQKLCKFFSVI